MGFYGDMNNINKTIFQFDKIYANKAEMDAAANSDGVFVGRYVLVEYGSNEELYDDPNVQEGEQETIYNHNYGIDDPNKTSRGWDSTVWQKISVEDGYQYIMIAELNSVIPTIGIEVNAPTPSPELPIWNIQRSSNILYKLQLQPSWGFKVKETTTKGDYESNNLNKYSDIYFNKAGFNPEIRSYINNITDEITVEPTGRSNNIYANDSNNTKPDIYELSIHLPVIGNTISQIWDIMYGVNNTNNTRNTNISYGNSNGIRAITYDANGVTYNVNNLNTVAGLINSLHDLIGNIIVTENVPQDINDWEDDKIYYTTIQNETGFYYQAHQWTPVGENENWKTKKPSGYIAQKIDLGKDLNTIHGLLLKISQILEYGNENTLDARTVQGSINRLNKLIGSFTGNIELIEGNWIEGELNEAGTKTQLWHKKLFKADNDESNLLPITPRPSNATDDNNITLDPEKVYSYYPKVDLAGHVIGLKGKEISFDSVNDDIEEIKDFVGMSSSATENDSLSDQISEITSLIRKDNDEVIVGTNDTGIRLIGNGNRNLGLNFNIEINEEIKSQSTNKSIYIEIAEWNNLELQNYWKIYRFQESENVTHINEIVLKNKTNNANITRLSSQDYYWDSQQKFLRINSESISVSNSNEHIMIVYSISTPVTVNNYSLTFGSRAESKRKGNFSAVTGFSNEASGDYSHAEGFQNVASGNYSHAEGFYTTASDDYSHAEGFHSIASNDYSHAEGDYTEASGRGSHAEGNYTKASGFYSHAEGDNTLASGDYSHAQNKGTVASIAAQTAMGKYNVIEETTSETKHALIIGNGISDNDRSNALTVDWNGNVVAGTYNEVDIEQLSSDVTTINTTVESLSSSITNTNTTVESLSSSISAINMAIQDFPTIAAMNYEIAAAQPTVKDVTDQFSISATSYTSRGMTLQKVFKYGDMIYVWMQASRTKDWVTGTATNGRFFCKLEGTYLPLLTTPIFTPLGTSAVRGYILGKYGDPTTTAISIDSTKYNIFLVPSTTIDSSSAMINIYFNYLAANYTEPTNPEGE